MTKQMTDQDGNVQFEAMLRPARSLSPKGFRILMIVAASLGLVIGGAFFMGGAWPVLGFCGLELVLLYIAFRVSYARGNRWERLTLTDSKLTVTRGGPATDPGKWEFQPQWLQITMDDPPQHESQLELRSHGKGLTIGRFLPPHERLEVANALRVALRRWREPGRLAPT
ncbi:MAG: DUF2244 domain-containing protein [Pseudomonadota bacterium]